MVSIISPNLELGEVKLKVSNLERSLQFYQEVVGFKVLKQNARNAELTVDGRKTMLVLEEIADAVITSRRSVSGLYHFAILLPTRRDLGVTLRRLIESGIHIGQADHLVSEALYIADPDNNGIEIYRDRPRETWTRDDKGNYIMGSDPIDWDGLLAEAEDSYNEEELNKTEGNPNKALPPGTSMGHIHFHVSDLVKSEQFYCHLLGFDISADARKQMGALFISAGGYHHHIGLNIWAGLGAPPPPANAVGLAYYTLRIPEMEGLELIISKLKEAGFPVSEHDEAYFVKDPSGILLRLVSTY